MENKQNSFEAVKNWGYSIGEGVIKGSKRFSAEIVCVAAMVGLGAVGRWLDYQLHPEVIESLRQNLDLIHIMEAPFQAYNLLNEANPLVARLLEIGLGIGVAQLDIMKRSFGKRKLYVS